MFHLHHVDRVPREVRAVRVGAILAVFVAGCATMATIPPAAEREQERNLAGDRGPRLVVSPDPLDLGVVPKGDERELAFTLRNEGDALLRFEGVTISSDGLEVTAVPTEIPPGEEGVLEARKVFRTEDGPGELTLTLETNEAEEPFRTLRAIVEVREHVTATPRKLRWISVQHESDGILPVDIESVDGQPFRITDYAVEREGLDVTVEAVEPTASETSNHWKLTATLHSDAPVGPILGEILVDLEGSHQNFVRIPISGLMRPLVWADPPALDFEGVELPESKSQTFVVKTFGTDPVHVTGAHHDLPGLPQPVLKEVSPGRHYVVILEFPETLPAGSIEGRLVLETDSPKQPTLVIPVNGSIAPTISLRHP